MTYNEYRYIFYGGAGLAGLCLVVAVILFFVLKIPRVIGDLTGVSARKAIEDIRNQNENSGKKTYRSSTVNRERGRVTAKMTPSGNLMANPTDETNAAMATVKIRTQHLPNDVLSQQEDGMSESVIPTDTTVLTSEETTVLDATGSEETTVLNPAGLEDTTVLNPAGLAETTVLSPAASEETTVLSPVGSQETTVLSPAGSQETTVLSPMVSEETTVLGQSGVGKPVEGVDGFVIEYELTLIHTDEMIA